MTGFFTRFVWLVPLINSRPAESSSSLAATLRWKGRNVTALAFVNIV